MYLDVSLKRFETAYTAGGSINSTVTLSLPELEAHAQPVDWVDVSMCIAVMQLVFGAAQPVFGMVASKRSNRFVLILGVLLMGISMA